MRESTRLVIADDHPLFRFGLVSMLGAEPEFTVAGEAAGQFAEFRNAHAGLTADFHTPGCRS